MGHVSYKAFASAIGKFSTCLKQWKYLANQYGDVFYLIFIFLAALSDVEKELSELKTVVNVLEDEKKRQANGK